MEIDEVKYQLKPMNCPFHIGARARVRGPRAPRGGNSCARWGAAVLGGATGSPEAAAQVASVGRRRGAGESLEARAAPPKGAQGGGENAPAARCRRPESGSHRRCPLRSSCKLQELA